MQVLNPSTMPLVGQALIEASAGTGKTYTITGLYLRYLLGMYGLPEQTSTPLSIDQILVVTFTEAATQEIKDRVRKRIVLMRDALFGATVKDELVNSLLAKIDDQQRAFALLDAAAKSMDEAAIFTIHGFCQRMLKQHAFESNLAFNQSFVLDQSELIEQAVQDFWRQFLYPMPKSQAQTILSVFASPQQLSKALSPYIYSPQAVIEPSISLADVLKAKEQYQQDVPEFKRKVLEMDFIGAICASDISGNKSPKHKANLSALADYLQSTEWYFEFGKEKKSFETWGHASIADPSIYKKNGQPFTHELIAEFDRLSVLHDRVKNGLSVAIIQQALSQVRAHIAEHKARYNVLTPDDLLTKLHDALFGQQGDVLANNIRAQYPVALIDEFQDTDPVQYGIFNRIFVSSQHDSVLPQLTMIGDPKQAIYGFRGADIFTYIAAKHAVDESRHFTLATNFRSDLSVVKAVNAIFTQHKDSFIFNDDIPFIEVAAKGKQPQDVLTIEGNKPNAMELTVLKDDQPVTSKSAALPALAKIYAKKIATLLQQAATGKALIGSQPVAASDICVLVRDRLEASVIKQALQHAGISAVYLSRDSVFKQPLAAHLFQFISVLFGTYDEGLIRGVLASPLFGLKPDALFALQEDEKQWQVYLEQLFKLRKTWSAQGAMAMLESLLVENNLAKLWTKAGFNVERMLTDYRHLAELLQQKQLELDGTQRVIRWLHQQLLDNSNEGVQLRLESDANLVKIITMHASKGLEYPIVYLPFATTYREASEIKYHRDGKTVIEMCPSEQGYIKAQRERLAEDIRLLYVALTRAVHFCSVGCFNIASGKSKSPGIQNTALGFVLFGQNEFKAAAEWHQMLQSIAHNYAFELDFQEVNNAHEASETQLASTSLKTSLSVKVFDKPLQRNWRSTSFSALTYHASHDDRPLGAMDENHTLDLPSVASEILDSYSFPKGAKAGSCLHEIFEVIDFTDPHEKTDAFLSLSEAVEQSLQKYGIDAKWQEATCIWIERCLKARLGGDEQSSLSLSQLAPSQCLVEMEFYLPLKLVNAKQINHLLTLCTGHPASLQFDEIQGLLKGFIDLVFEWQGRYFVLDYKSNYLGERASDYGSQNLESAMHSHQYHLQYILYTVALHRLLKSRIPHYSPSTHLGGAYYLFLRALPDAEGIYFKQLSEEYLLAFDALFATAEGN